MESVLLPDGALVNVVSVGACVLPSVLPLTCTKKKKRVSAQCLSRQIQKHQFEQLLQVDFQTVVFCVGPTLRSDAKNQIKQALDNFDWNSASSNISDHVFAVLFVLTAFFAFYLLLILLLFRQVS